MLSSAIAESALSRGSSNRKSVWSTWTARSITDQAWHVVSRFTGLQQHACFVAGSLAFKRGRGERAIARLEQSQICMVNLDCAINIGSSLACCVKIYGPAAACVLCSWFACFQAQSRRARYREARAIANLDGQLGLRDQLTDPAWNVVSRFTGLQQHACFVAGPLALKRPITNRISTRRARVFCQGLRARASSWFASAVASALSRGSSNRQSGWFNYQSSLACCDCAIFVAGPLALPIKLGKLGLFKFCSKISRGSRPVWQQQAWHVVLCSWFACFQARSRRVRYREDRAIANLYGQLIWMAEFDCAISYQSTLPRFAKI